MKMAQEIAELSQGDNIQKLGILQEHIENSRFNKGEGSTFLMF
jgi:hypothetical protein